ncbi:MAG: AsmA-like C-terminal region-containing protein [Pseudomonadota bacterium]
MRHFSIPRPVRRVGLVGICAAFLLAGPGNPTIAEEATGDVSAANTPTVSPPSDPLSSPKSTDADLTPVTPTQADVQPADADEAKFYWGSARVEFNEDRVVVRRPRFDIAGAGNVTTPAAFADPGLLQAILEPAFKALDGVRTPKVEIIDGEAHLTHAGRARHRIDDLNAVYTYSPASGLLTGRGTFQMRGETARFDVALARPVGADKATEKATNTQTTAAADTTGADGASTPPTTTGIPIRLSLKGAGLAAKFEGRFHRGSNARLEGTTSLVINDLVRLARWAGLSPSADAEMGALKAAGQIDWTPGLFAMTKGAFTLDQNNANGVLTLDLRGDRTSLEGTLAIGRLDLSRYVKQKPSAKQATVLGALMPSLEPEMTINAPMLREFDADVRVSVDAVDAGSFRTGAGAMVLTLRSGKLSADVAELQAFGGSMLGQFELDATKDHLEMSVRSRLDDIQASEIMRWISSVPALRGVARLKTNLAATGKSLGELLRTLKGDMRLTMLEGGAFLIDVDGLLKRANGKSLLGWDAARRAETRFRSLEASLSLGNGRISSRKLWARRGDDGIVAFGTVNMPQRSLAIRMSIIPQAEDRPAGETITLRGPVLAVRGPWDEPSITVEQQARYDDTDEPVATAYD